MERETILSEVQLKAVRSSGPGGQNVNKVSTKIQLSFDIANSLGLSEEEKERILTKLAKKLNADGMLIISSDQSRSQLKNKEAALIRLFETLEKASVVPKTRKATKVPKSVVEQRLKAKKTQSEIKESRKRPKI